MKRLYIITILILVLSLNAQALFEVKDASDNTVLEVSQDGLRIFNMGDTLMVISSSEIKAFINESTKDRALSRSFSVTTSTSAEKGVGDVVNIASDGLRVFSANENLMDITKGNITAYIDTSFSFNVTSTTGGKAETDLLEVTTESTKMREGGQGNEYTDFSLKNIFVGLKAGTDVTIGVPLAQSGSENVFLGNYTGLVNTSGYSNIFIGNRSGYNNTVGDRNTYIGDASGQYAVDGDLNTFVGAYSGNKHISGTMNTYIGAHAAANSTGGDNNTFVGYASGIDNSTGRSNSFYGYWAGHENGTGNYNNLFGVGAGYSNTGGKENVIMGNEAGFGTYGVPSVYNYNCLFGHQAGHELDTGSQNVMMGYRSGYDTTTGGTNTFIGNYTGYNNTIGSSNTFLGSGAGRSNIAGIQNVFLGYNAGYNEMGSNKLYIDNSNTATPLIYGEFDNDSLQVNGDLNVTSDVLVSGEIKIPSLYTTTSANATKSLYVDSLGVLCVAAKKVENLINKEDFELLKEENEKLNKRLNEIEEFLKKLNR